MLEQIEPSSDYEIVPLSLDGAALDIAMRVTSPEGAEKVSGLTDIDLGDFLGSVQIFASKIAPVTGSRWPRDVRS